MKKICLSFLTFVVWWKFGYSQDPDSIKASIAYVQKLQTSTGGFLSMEPKPNIRLAPTLRSTSSAIRTLKYLGAEVPNKEACKKFVAQCFDPKSGGFADMPGGKPDVFTTAVGIMAYAELKMTAEAFEPACIQFLDQNVKTFDDVRIAVAGLERINKKSPKADEWLTLVRENKFKGEPEGPTSGRARHVGSNVVTQLRLGRTYPVTEGILKTLQGGQRNDGGFGKEGQAGSDLETTYRIMRAYVMLKSKPGNISALQLFVEKCRNPDGGYGMTPGDPSTVGTTYFATIIQYWLKEMK